jgi:hypothetical protein
MATGIWNEAAVLLREAADTIEQRAVGRDVSGLPDTVAVAAACEGLTEAVVLASLVGLKRARYARGGDRDSAVDLLAYEARRLAQTVRPIPETDGFKHGPAIDPPEDPLGELSRKRLAALQARQAEEAGNLNHGSAMNPPGPDEE